jgi:hypothetical protein
MCKGVKDILKDKLKEYKYFTVYYYIDLSTLFYKFK